MLDAREIKRRRDAEQLSQPEAAKRGNLPGGGQAWSNIERGDVSDIRLATLEALARGLHCSIADIVIEEYPPTRSKRRDR